MNPHPPYKTSGLLPINHLHSCIHTDTLPKSKQLQKATLCTKCVLQGDLSHLEPRPRHAEKFRRKKRILLKTWRINRECWPASICSLNSSLFHCFFFSSNWNWLSYEMNMINASPSPPAAASDWAQRSPNYQRGTHQRWPAAASLAGSWARACALAHVHPASTHWFWMRRGKKKEEKKGGRSSQTTWKWSQPPTHAGASALRVTMTVALMRCSLAGEQPARGFNWESEQVLAVHQIGGLDGYFKWPDMNYRREPWLCCAY